MAMETQTIRVSRSTHAIVRELAARSERTMSQVVDVAVRELQKKQFWADYHAAYAALNADPEARADFEREMRAWDVTLADGLEAQANEHQESRRQSLAR
jgi:hypothetical protein